MTNTLYVEPGRIPHRASKDKVWLSYDALIVIVFVLALYVGSKGEK